MSLHGGQLCDDVYTAYQTVEHDDVDVLCLSSCAPTFRRGSTRRLRSSAVSGADVAGPKLAAESTRVALSRTPAWSPPTTGLMSEP
jgi:hypothetical protein